MLNVVPDTVVVDGMIRANNLTALEAASAAFDRAFEGCAHAIGAKAEVESWQGYMPIIYQPANDALRLAAAAVNADGNLTIEEATVLQKNAASSDVGDLSHVMPIVNFTHGGVKGALHSADFSIVDEQKALILPAKMFALSVYHLLKNNAELAKKEIAEHKPVFTKKGYKEYVDTFK